MSGLLPGDLTRTTVTEIFATSNQPQQQDTLHERLRIEDESGKIWQEGCGDQRETDVPARRGSSWTWSAGSATSRPGSGPTGAGSSSGAGKRCSSVAARRPRLDARLAPTQTCTPGEFPTSTPTPSPSPTPSPTPEATVAPTLEPTPTPSPTPAQPTP